MAKKITKKEIIVNQQTKEKPDGISPITVLVGSKRLLDGSDGFSVSEKLGALILGQQVLDDLKAQIDNLLDQLSVTSIEDLNEALIKEGRLSEGETAVISVVNKSGKKISKVLTTTTMKSLDMGPFKDLVKDPAVFKALPDEYKKTDIQSKSWFSSKYAAGEIDPMYEKYFSLETNVKTTLKAIKMDKED